MQKIIVSSIFFLISAILLSTKYISTSILLAKSGSLNSDLIRGTFRILPFELTMFYLISFILGVIFFVLGIQEIKNINKFEKKSSK